MVQGEGTYQVIDPLILVISVTSVFGGWQHVVEFPSCCCY
jgi:hypothetical protein